MNIQESTATSEEFQSVLLEKGVRSSPLRPREAGSASCIHALYCITEVLGHGHVFEVWILISSGSDIIIQIRTHVFGVI